MDEKNVIRQNAALMGFFHEARLAQDPKDRLHYLDNALEATVNPATRGKLVQRLYQDTLKKANFDFGKIGASRGNLTKYVHYDKLMASYDCLLALSENKPSESIRSFKRLHDILIEARADFEMGYKFNIELIELTYKTLVLSLHQLLDSAICETVDILRETVQIQSPGKDRVVGQYGTIVLKNVNAFISAYDHGEWNRMIASFKKDPKAMIGAVLDVASAPLLVVGAIAAILLAIRGLIYFYYNSKTRLRDYAASEAELLRINMAMDKTDAPGAEKRKAVLNALERVAGISEVRNKNADRDTSKDLDDANKTLYGPGAFDGSGDFELI